VTILGQGDLSPRRRQRSVRRYVTVGLVLAVLAGGAYAAYVGFIRGSSTHVAADPPPSRCARQASSPYAAPHTLRVRIFNASLQTGLASQVRSSLRHRGFRVAQIGNAMRVGHYAAEVRYSSDQKLGSVTLAAQVTGATTREVTGQHVLELDLGLKYQQMRSTTAARTLAHHVAASAAPTPSASPTPSCVSAAQ
jgi:hypothetical protein